MQQLQGLLDEALARTSFTLLGGKTRCSAADIRALYLRGALQQVIGIAATIPEPLSERLIHEMERFLSRYVNPETKCVGLGLIYVLGGMVDPPLRVFTERVVCAAARLGTERLMQLLCEWSGGKPVSYERRAVLFGCQINEVLELREEGIHLDRVPVSTEQAVSVLPATLQAFAPLMGSSSVLGRPLLSVACSMRPIFYAPPREKDSEWHHVWAHGRLPAFSMEAFCEALSLACNGCIQPNHEWSHAPELEMVTAGRGGSMSRAGGF